MSWQQYHQKLQGRPPRPLFTKAIELFQSQKGAAIDLGCGSGAETIELLTRGWQVTAIDKELSAYESIKSLVDPIFEPKLQFIGKAFEEIDSLPKSDFVFAYHSLPFCRNAQEQDRTWEMIGTSLGTGGIFAGSFFGLKDDWVKQGHCVGVSEEKISDYFKGFEILHRKEIDQVGPTALGGPKHWHVFEIIAKRIL